MHPKPDWYKSRTLWTGVVAFVVSVISQVYGPDAGTAVEQWLGVLLPVILMLLGVTERKNAAQVN